MQGGQIMKIQRRFFFILVLLLLCSGCAHNIKINPKLDNIGNEGPSQKINKNVGYYISTENIALQTTTSAGGGDSVKYAPYSDLEPAFNLVLSNIFTTTYMIKDLNDISFLQDKDISFVFIPRITTTSSSRNAFFWPPTDFSMTINCIAVDKDQTQVWQTTVQADNDVVAVSEIIKDHSLVGKLAAENALKKLQKELIDAAVFRNK